jgi:hypothetical protein
MEVLEFLNLCERDTLSGREGGGWLLKKEKGRRRGYKE